MPELEWNEKDIIKCLGVKPQYMDYGLEYWFQLTRKGMVLDLVVSPLENLVRMCLLTQETGRTVVEFGFHVWGPITLIEDDGARCLDFAEAQVSSRWRRMDGPQKRVRLRVDPQIQIEFLD